MNGSLEAFSEGRCHLIRIEDGGVLVVQCTSLSPEVARPPGTGLL